MNYTRSNRTNCYTLIFVQMPHGENGYKYVLILKDDQSVYIWLTPTEHATAESTDEVLVRWFAAFGVVTQWVSNRGSHFKNQLIRLLSERIKSSHHFKLAYCPWSNGTIEAVCRELLRTVRAILSELQLPQSCWPSIFPIVQYALNNSIAERLGNKCPLTVFSGLPQDTPLRSITHSDLGSVVLCSIAEVNQSRMDHIQRLQSTLVSMHKEVSSISDKKRKSAVNSHNRKTNIRAINFSEGDFVSKGTLQRERRRKPSLRWLGPLRVIECKSDYIFLVEDLITGERQEIHGRRLKVFRNKSFEITAKITEHLSYQQGELLVVQ